MLNLNTGSNFTKTAFLFNGRKYVPFYYWSKIYPILLLVDNMSTLFIGRKYVRQKCVRGKYVR